MTVLKNPYNTGRAQTVKEQLLASSQPSDQLLGEALATFLNRSASREEQTWFDSIEALRRRLSNSEDKISVIDYGLPRDGEPGTAVERRVAQICRAAATPPLWGPLQFGLVRQFKPEVCLELGTSLGISAAFQAAALELNGKGKLITLEGAPEVADLARKHLKSIGINCVEIVTGRFQDTLDGVLARVGPVDFAFIDGHHDEHATLAYFEQILPYLAPRAVLAFDDIAWSDGMRMAWKKITEHSSVRTAVDLSKIGICVLERDTTGSTRKSLLAWHPHRWQRVMARIGFAS
jgi:predicted O-methyltransferase YrrM